MSDLESKSPLPDQQPAPEKPSIEPREIFYSEFGYTGPVQEVLANDPKIVKAINKINTTLPPEHYAEANPNETLDETREWLEETTSPFDAANLKEESIVIAAKSISGEEIDKYVYYYPSEENLPEALEKQYKGKAVLDVSYVCAEAEESQSAEEIAKIIKQSSMLIVERSLGRDRENLSGRLTPDDVVKADQSLVFLATVQSKGEETSYGALQQAGFEKVHTYLYKEEGEQESVEYTVLSLSPANLVSKFNQGSEQTPPSTS